MKALDMSATSNSSKVSAVLLRVLHALVSDTLTFILLDVHSFFSVI